MPLPAPLVWMDPKDLVGAVLVVAQRYNIDVQDLGATMRKLIVLSVKYVSQREIWGECFGEDYVDWELVQTTVGQTRGLLPCVAEWLGLLAYMSWDDLHKHEATIPVNFPVLQVMRSHMRECSLDTGGEAAWTLVCKALILYLLKGLPTQHALELLTCEAFRTSTRDACMQLMAKQVHLVVWCAASRWPDLRAGAGRAPLHAGAVPDDAGVAAQELRGQHQGAAPGARALPGRAGGAQDQPEAVADHGAQGPRAPAGPGLDRVQDGGAPGPGGRAVGHVGQLHRLLLPAPVPGDALDQAQVAAVLSGLADPLAVAGPPRAGLACRGPAAPEGRVASRHAAGEIRSVLVCCAGA